MCELDPKIVRVTDVEPKEMARTLLQNLSQALQEWAFDDTDARECASFLLASHHCMKAAASIPRTEKTNGQASEETPSLS